jgi:hypothetical protein
MMMYRGVEVKIQAFLTSALDEAERSASCFNALIPGKESPGG